MNQPEEVKHPLAIQNDEETARKIKEFVTTYGPYITLAFFVYRFYTQLRLNKTLARIEKGLKLR